MKYLHEMPLQGRFMAVYQLFDRVYTKEFRYTDGVLFYHNRYDIGFNRWIKADENDLPPINALFFVAD